MNIYNEVKKKLEGKDKKYCVEFAVKCALKVLPIFEAEHPKDNRPRQAIEAAQKWLKEPTEENRNAAYTAATLCITDTAAAFSADSAAAAYKAAVTAYATHSGVAYALAANAAAYAATAAKNKIEKEIMEML